MVACDDRHDEAGGREESSGDAALGGWSDEEVAQAVRGLRRGATFCAWGFALMVPVWLWAGGFVGGGLQQVLEPGIENPEAPLGFQLGFGLATVVFVAVSAWFFRKIPGIDRETLGYLLEKGILQRRDPP